MVICAFLQRPYKAYAAVPALNALHDLLHIGTIYGSYMVHIWFLYCPYMVFIWSISGSYMVHIWFLNVSYMVHIWFPHVSYMVHNIHGYYMVHTRLLQKTFVVSYIVVT